MTPWPYPFWIAHRGAGKLAPENTLAAFRLGAQHGYRMFECDAKLSADGAVFLLHDATLERTTNGHGVAGELPWHTLSQLDAGGWHSRAYAGEPPCSPAYERSPVQMWQPLAQHSGSRLSSSSSRMSCSQPPQPAPQRCRAACCWKPGGMVGWTPRARSGARP